VHGQFPGRPLVLLSGRVAAGSVFNTFAGCDSSIFGQCGLSMLTEKTVTAQFDGSGPAPRRTTR
jgi:hypothetical protein